MLFYVIKTRSDIKNVLVLISMHKNVLAAREKRKKLHVITFYNRTKVGADVMDITAEIPTANSRIHRWTMNGLAYILDSVRTNMLTLWNEIHSDDKIGLSDFAWKLGEGLINPHVQVRYQNVTVLQRSAILAMKTV